MRKDKDLAIGMRKTGSTYAEIRDALKIPKSTLSDWFSGENWSNDIKKKLTTAAYEVHAVRMRELGRVRGIHLVKIYEEARLEALQEFIALKYNPLFIAGMMLYWGEGDKVTKHQTRLTNVDPGLIRLFITFLDKACQIPLEKIRLNVLIYPDLDPDKCIQYWSTQSGLSKNHFTKCIVIQGRHKTKRLSYGICIANVSSAYFKAKIIKWLDVLPQELMGKTYYESI
ncbi:MAG: hypothetical protein A2854_03310 [Parcubacteria group bacterium RIFCSPHIGHO2_01_FULL_56_18]|nr:MAG: hypothetical protein A2854_03310 [Parcubacteria group bacterium RIFCSPHIGHO2_01_FULL_56_18]